MKALQGLRDLISEGRFGPSGRLPPERVLAPQLGVSRGALRNALDRLEEEGLIWRHVGRGTYVGQRPQAGKDPFAPALRLTNPAEVMEVRLIIEPRIAKLAALRASGADHERLETLLAHGERAADTPAFERWDGELHRALAVASRNSFLLAIFDAINDVRRNAIWGRLKEQTLNDARRNRYARQHRELVELVRDRDVEGAKAAMRKHLVQVRDDLLAT